MNESLFINIIIGISIASTPLIFAAIGELLVERSGVLNLGVEGMMIVGALLGFIVQFHTGNPFLAVLAALLGGMAISSIFAFLTQFLLTNQVATGLALTLFGLGFSAFAGAKNAKRALAQSMARELGPKGIHVAHIIIDGIIDGDKVNLRFPDFANSKGEDGKLDIDSIAENFLMLHKQQKSTWSFELDLRPWSENW